MYLESKSSDRSREISKNLYYECQIRGSFCARSEELVSQAIRIFPRGVHARGKGGGKIRMACKTSEEYDVKTLML